jgi:hypothetical protein
MGRGRFVADKTGSIEAERKPLWNSLETARLVAACATPLLIFIFGLIVSSQTREADYKWKYDEKKETRLREDRATKAAAARLEADRIASLRRDAAQREEARKDAAVASLLAFQREQALLDRTAARDTRLRAEARAEDRRERTLQQRRRVWDEAREPLTALNERVSTITREVVHCRGCTRDERYPTDEELKNLRLQLETSMSGIDAYDYAFSGEASLAAMRFALSVRAFLGMIEEMKAGVPIADNEFHATDEKVADAYKALISAMARDLAAVE